MQRKWSSVHWLDERRHWEQSTLLSLRRLTILAFSILTKGVWKTQRKCTTMRWLDERSPWERNTLLPSTRYITSAFSMDNTADWKMQRKCTAVHLLDERRYRDQNTLLPLTRLQALGFSNPIKGVSKMRKECMMAQTYLRCQAELKQSSRCQHDEVFYALRNVSKGKVVHSAPFDTRYIIIPLFLLYRRGNKPSITCCDPLSA